MFCYSSITAGVGEREQLDGVEGCRAPKNVSLLPAAAQEKKSGSGTPTVANWLSTSCSNQGHGGGNYANECRVHHSANHGGLPTGKHLCFQKSAARQGQQPLQSSHPLQEK